VVRVNFAVVPIINAGAIAANLGIGNTRRQFSAVPDRRRLSEGAKIRNAPGRAV